LLREKGSVAAEILHRHGLELETVRDGPFESDVVVDEVDCEALYAAVMALPAGRRDAAWRIVEALGGERVRIEVSAAENSFTISFGEGSN
jgi:hypothetical protein